MLSIALVLIVVGLCGILGLTVHRAARTVGSETSLLITIHPGSDRLEVSALKRKLNVAPWATRYDFTEAKDILMRESEAMDADSRNALELLADNPFGDEFVVYVADGYRSADSLTSVVNTLKAEDVVEEVTGSMEIAGTTNDALNQILIYLGILAVALLLISITLISNTISLAIYSRRFNINTMKLVGATNAFIRRPFVRAGMATGALAGVIAAIVVCGVEYWFMSSEPIVGRYITLTDIILTSIALVVAGLLFARAAAWCAASRYLNKTYDQLFKK